MTDLAKKAFYDAAERNFTFVVAQDVEPILEANKTSRSEAQRGDWRKVASIPNVILMRWLNEERDRGNIGLRMYTDEFDWLVERKLADPDWAYLRSHDPGANGWMGFGS